MDCHGAGGDCSFNSLIPDALDARCEFVVQTRWTEYTAFLEQGCDAALFVGQHAMAGAERGVLSHTVSSTNWHALHFNGVEVGEVGDQRRAVRHLGLPGGARHRRRRRLRRGARAARRRAPHARRQDRRSAASAPATSPPPAPASGSSRPPATRRERASAPVYDPGAPCTITVELNTSDQADPYRHRAGVTVTGPRTIEATADSWWDAWRAIYLTRG